MTAKNEFLLGISPLSLLCATDLSAYKSRFVDLNSSGDIALAAAAGRVFGIMEYGAAAGDPSPVQTLGAPYITLGDTVVPGVVKSDSVGRAVQASAADIAAGYACGFVLNGGAVGERVGCMLFSGSKVAGNVVDALTSAGAASVYTEETTLAFTGTVAFTLADGLFVGQRKRVRCISAGSTPLGTLTLSDAYGSESLTHVFTAAGQELELEWTSTGWKVIRKIRAGVQVCVAGTTVLTGYDMAAVYSLTVDGTKVSSTTKGIPDGQVPGERIMVCCSAAINTPIGSIAFTGLKVDNTALVDLQAIGAVTDQAQLSWTGAAWLVEAQTGITLA